MGKFFIQRGTLAARAITVHSKEYQDEKHPQGPAGVTAAGNLGSGQRGVQGRDPGFALERDRTAAARGQEPDHRLLPE
ncbi:hypothetical protein D3C80_1648150 [compost metagenome]